VPGWKPLSEAPGRPDRLWSRRPGPPPNEPPNPPDSSSMDPSDLLWKAWIPHRLLAHDSLLGVDSGGIVGFRPHLLLAAPFLCFAALEVVTQRRGQTSLRHRLFLLFCPLAHTDRLRLRQPCGKDRRRFRRCAPPVPVPSL